MRKSLLFATLIAILLAIPVRSQAHDYDREDSDHVLRLLGYALHPIGQVLDYGIMRPIHCFVSATPRRNFWFGHQSYGKGCNDQKESVTVTTTADGGADAASGDGGAAASAGDDRGTILGVRPLDQMMIIYFDYDRHNIRADQLSRIDQNVQFLKERPELSLMIEGHCDERGTNEYNLALGERRARAVMDYYIKSGIDARRMTLVSKGEEEPADPGHDEPAWAKNRRAEFKEPIKDK